MSDKDASVAWTRDGETRVATVAREVTRRFRIEQRTVFVVIEEREKPHLVGMVGMARPLLLGGGWTDDGRELAIASTLNDAEACLERVAQRSLR